MILNSFLFLAAYTSRSQAYAQILHRNGLAPENVLLFGDPSKDDPKKVLFDEEALAEADIFFPDLSETLTATCKRARWTVSRSPESNVNHPGVTDLVREIEPDYVIYSGYGGQIVKPALLDLGIPFLHMHSGWLPEYGGSTTLYYSWLRENRTAVTAFILDPQIDKGPVIARRRYPAPSKGIDVDHLYDGAIRADTLLHVLKEFIADGAFPTISRDEELEIYFVIHPVLKHLALISREDAA